MNILFFTRLFYPHIGGVEKHVFEISKILIQKGHKVIVVAEKHDGELKNFQIINKIEIYRISISGKGWFKKFEIWNWLLKHQNLIKQADIIHCHDVFFWYLPFRFLFLRKPIFTTFHGYEGNETPTKGAIFMHKLAEKLSFGNICVGDYLKKWYGTEPNCVTYGAIGLNKIKNSVKKNDINSKLKILFIGRLEEEAGIMTYLKALKILKDKGYKIKIIALGDGIQRLQAEQYCSSNKLEADFKGFVNNVSYYLYVTNLVFTSRFLSTLEALNMKKFTFVIYNNAIHKDCFAMSPFANFISLSKDEKSLINDFIYYINNQNLMYNKIEKGYEWVKKQTWNKLGNMYLDLWRSK